MSTPYTVLEVPQDATPQVIRRAYHALALKHHPDKIANPAFQKKGEKRFKEVQSAWEILSDPVKRAELDRRLPRQADERLELGSHWYSKGRLTSALGRKKYQDAIKLRPLDYPSSPIHYYKDSCLTVKKAIETKKAYGEASALVWVASDSFRKASYEFSNSRRYFADAARATQNATTLEECAKWGRESHKQELELTKLHKQTKLEHFSLSDLATGWMHMVLRLLQQGTAKKEALGIIIAG
ncbi:DnaJ-domain-containing protein [Lophium mytilinum]|uniref:DnaJ-domain-containing protein n=1 Tax=Lophium mytilinum TaxID=390894 RepID=A0A6A6QKJ4_9PEZI|nr:DnaJ-domain-containing protein [Lophium mytilinum]